MLVAPVVVGIDGSDAAVQAAIWAADEARSRGVPLRLVHVIDVEDEVDREFDGDPAVVARNWPETEHGTTCLDAAATAVRVSGDPLHLETEIVWGRVDQVLLEESETATMVCVGSGGIAPLCRELLGSTAAVVAARAHCPVAVIRARQPSLASDWIVAVIDDSAGSEAVAEFALEEACLRRAPVLALGVSRGVNREVHYDDLARRVASWRHEHPNVHIHCIAVPTDAATFLAQHGELSVQLTVLDAVDSERTPAIVGPHRPKRSAPQHSSVLVVR